MNFNLAWVDIKKHSETAIVEPDKIQQGLLIPAKETSLHRPYGTTEFTRGIRFPHAEARG
jgi:hypothetical protein